VNFRYLAPGCRSATTARARRQLEEGPGQPQATLKQYANLQGLQTLAQATVSVTATTTKQAGPNGTDLATAVTITNTSSTPTVGFLLRADVRRGTAGGQELPGDNELQC